MKAVTMLDFQAKAGSHIARFLLDHGRVFATDDEAVRWLELGELGECYRNSWSLSWDMQTEGWAYVEGYATSASLLGLPLMHAWLLTDEGLAVDPTWELGLDYYGVVIPHDVAAEVMAVTERYGVLDGLWVVGARKGQGAVEKILARIADAQP